MAGVRVFCGRIMSFTGYCKLLDKGIHEGTCVEIISELYGGKKEEEIKTIRKSQKIKNEDIEKICSDCPNYPSDEIY